MKIIEEETNEKWTFDQELQVKDPETTYARWVKYVNEYEEGATLYEGFMEVFEAFQKHGIQQAIVSAKTRNQYQLDICSKGIDQYMDTVILAEDTEKHKPNPEPLLKCIENLHVSAEEVIYIGDALSDQQASCNAGIDFAMQNGEVFPTFLCNAPVLLIPLLTFLNCCKY